MRELASKLKGPGLGLAAGLIVLPLGAGYLLALGVAVFVGVIAWTWVSAADRRVDGYGHHHASGWMADGGDGFDGGGDGGGGDGLPSPGEKVTSSDSLLPQVDRTSE